MMKPQRFPQPCRGQHNFLGRRDANILLRTDTTFSGHENYPVSLRRRFLFLHAMRHGLGHKRKVQGNRP
eukprot:scaffold7362_cov266-Pinguiococcus_pyrenoidosus.AAC.1